MQDVDPKALQKYLEEHSRSPSLVPWAMGILEAVFATAERGEFELATPLKFERADAKKALTQATDASVLRVAAVSLSGTSYGLDFCKEEYNPLLPHMMLARAWFCTVNRAMQDMWSVAMPGLAPSGLLMPKEELAKKMETIFHHALGDNHATDVMEELGERGWYGLRADLEECVESALEQITKSCLRKNLDEQFDLKRLGETLRNNIWSILFYFLAFVLLGDEDAAERFAPLVALLPQAIPLGERAESPGTWMFLIA